MNSELPDYDPQLLDMKLAVAKEMHRRGWCSDEELEREIERLQAEDDEERARFIAAGYEKFDIPRLEQEFHAAMARQERHSLSKTQRWLYSWNLEPEEDPFGLVSCWWKDDTAKERAEGRKRAAPRFAATDGDSPQPLDWLWPGRVPLGKVSLLTGDAGDGKSLVVADFIARATTGSGWPDGAPGEEPGDVLLVAPAAGVRDVVFPRLKAAGADLSRLQVLSTVVWQDRKTGEPDQDPFRLPFDGPLLEGILQQNERLRLVVIDPLSQFLQLPPAPAEREAGLHDILSDLADLAEVHNLAVLCVEVARSGGIIGTASARQWRAHYDAAFQTVWGVARDPRDREQRLLLPIRHHLGDDRTGLRFCIRPEYGGAARIEWGEREDSITYAEATGRVRLGRSVWSFSQTAHAEVWLRHYLQDGPKPSVDIFNTALEEGFTEHPLRSALRRVAVKFKQGKEGAWYWRLKDSKQNSRVSAEVDNLTS